MYCLPSKLLLGGGRLEELDLELLLLELLVPCLDEPLRVRLLHVGGQGSLERAVFQIIFI